VFFGIESDGSRIYCGKTCEIHPVRPCSSGFNWTDALIIMLLRPQLASAIAFALGSVGAVPRPVRLDNRPARPRNGAPRPKRGDMSRHWRNQSVERIAIHFREGTTAVLRSADGSWECEHDEGVERLLNTQWRLRDGADTLEALADRLSRAVGGRAIVELRRAEEPYVRVLPNALTTP